MSRLIFKNFGGSYQLRIQNAEDLEKIQILDEAHWAATSIPVSSLNCDEVFLSYVDTDKNGRIRTDELKKAQPWLFKFLANRSRLSEGTEVLVLDDIDTSHPEGQKLFAAAKRILTNLNLPDAREISLAEVRDVKSIMASSVSNGDGIIPPDASSAFDLAQFINSVMATVGSVTDANGQPGIGKEELKIFLEEAKAYLLWKGKSGIPKGSKKTEIMPWGVDTPSAFELLASMEEKIEQYFIQCAIVRFDGRAAGQMQLRQKELEEIDFTDKSLMEKRLKNAPLAMPNPKGILNFDKALNLLYAESLQALKEKVLKPALGRLTKQINEEEWQKVKAVFAPYRTWLENKEGAKVEKLGIDKLRTYLNGTYSRRVSELISRDLAVADNLNQIHNLEKLILYQRWLLELANNFVSFSNFYDPSRRSLFEMGTLVIDGREFTFIMKVKDRKRHKQIAENSYMYLMYLEITGRLDKEVKFEVVAAVTSGTAGRLHLGKRGVFFTTDGQEWDAEVIDIIENPISLWESVKAPFQQFAGFIKKQIDKFTQSRQTKVEETLAKPDSSGMLRDLLLGGGIAVAALGSALAYITKVLSQVRIVHILGMGVVIVALVLLPGMMAGFVKLRRRNMSVILEASGWAVNAHMKLNVLMGKLFTHLPHLPKGSRKKRKDLVGQFVKKSRYSAGSSNKLLMVILIIFLVIALAVFMNICTGWKIFPRRLF